MPTPLKFSNVFDSFKDLVVHPDPVTGSLVPKLVNQSLLVLPNETGVNCSIGWDTPATLVNATLDITVDSNNFTSTAILYLHTYKLTSNIDWAIGGSAALTAVNIAAAINTLEGFSATANAAVITVLGPKGGAAFGISFKAAYGGAIVNFSFSTKDFMTTPTITKPYIE